MPNRVTASLRAGQGGGQIIAQGEPVAILILPAEHALIRAVDIGQEFAQSLHSLHRAGFQRVKAIPLIHGGNFRQHFAALNHIRAEIIAKAFGRFGAWFARLFVFGHGETLCSLSFGGVADGERRGKDGIMTDKIEAMEERMAHLIRTVDDLSDIVAAQADTIDRLTRRMAMMVDRMAAPDEGGAVFTDQRPPHW